MPPPTVLIEQRAIAARIREMATELRAAIPNDDIHFVCVLKGAFMFLSDLMRAFDDRVTLDFIAVSSYGASTKSSGEVRLVKDVDTSLADRHVVIVEDIVDTGLTLHYLQDILRRRGPASLRTACLLSKPSRRQVDVTVDFIGFTIGDQFVVGYGLDYSE
jgi:hypoxanthine phosphoribosyltransferase